MPTPVETPRSIEEQLNAAVYSASTYNVATQIKQGYRVAYVVPSFVYERWQGRLNMPTVTVLCGSTRFKDAWYEEGRRLTYEGHIVLSVGDLDTSSSGRDVNVPIDPRLKERLDELHKRKIDLADEVFVLNVGGYVGDSTRSEIEYAQAHGKPVRYLEEPE